jgi:hypothetical protein
MENWILSLFAAPPPFIGIRVWGRPPYLQSLDFLGERLLFDPGPHGLGE